MHASIAAREFIGRSLMNVLDHPTYSPDLAPCDFFLFPKLQGIMRCRHGDVKLKRNRRDFRGVLLSKSSSNGNTAGISVYIGTKTKYFEEDAADVPEN